MILHNPFYGLQVEPDIICVEILELLDTFEFFDVIRRNLSDFQKADSAFVVNDCASLDISLGFVGQFHDVFGLAIDHVLEDVKVHNCTQVVDVADKDDFLAPGNKVIEGAAVCKGIKDITVSRRVPRFDCGIVVSGHGKLRIADDPGESGLIEGKNIDIMALILLNNPLSIIFRVERVHQNEGNIAIVGAVQVLLSETLIAMRDTPI